MPSRRRISSTTSDAFPTSVWMRMYALTAMALHHKRERIGVIVSVSRNGGSGECGGRPVPLGPPAQARAYTHQPSRPAVWTARDVDEDGAPMSSTNPPTRHERLLAWVEQWRTVLEPDRVEWCDGSDEEYAELCKLLVEGGTLQPL